MSTMRPARSASVVTIENLTAIPVGGSMSLVCVAPDESRSKDHGWSWVVCAGSFLILFLVYGIHTSFGVLLVALLDHFQESKAKTAWVGSIGLNLLFIMSPVTSCAANRYGVRAVTVLGGILISLGLFLTSYAENISVLYLTYGLLFGSGTSFCGTMALIISADYFDKHLSLATGIVAAGSSIGTLVLAPSLQFIMEKLGWQMTFRVMGIAGIVIACVGFVYKPVQRSEQFTDNNTLLSSSSPGSGLFDFSVLQNKAFVMWIIATTTAGFGYFIPHFFLVRYSEDLGIPLSQGSWLISYLGIASAIGRVVFGKLSDICCVQNLHIYRTCMFLSGLASALCPMVGTFGGLVLYVVVLGILDGSYIGLMSIVTLDIVGLPKIAPAWGILFFCQSFTYLLGPPAAGMVYDAIKTFRPVFYLASGPMILGGFILLFVPCVKTDLRTRTYRQEVSNLTNTLRPPKIVITCDGVEKKTLVVVERLTVL